MGVIVLYIHPTLQLLAILLVLYVFYLGTKRFRSLHLKHRVVFRWKRHVTMGTIGLIAWLIGIIGGLTMVKVYWRGVLITGSHGKMGLVMIPFIIFGLATGLYMNFRKGKRQALPLAHGICNLTLLILSLTQAVSGWGVYRSFILGE